jgi:hypothetical protein
MESITTPPHTLPSGEPIRHVEKLYSVKLVVCRLCNQSKLKTEFAKGSTVCQACVSQKLKRSHSAISFGEVDYTIPPLVKCKTHT